jgi:protein-tyrosine phosphatase
MSANEIIPNLWLGDHVAAKSKEFFKRMDIRLVVNCTKDLPFSKYLPSNCTKIRVPVHDNLEKEEIEKLGVWGPRIVNLIWEHYKEGHPIFIHCYAGVQRSAAVVSMFLIFFFRCSADEAIRRVIQRRGIAFQPRVNFLPAIYQFEKDLGEEIRKTLSK